MSTAIADLGAESRYDWSDLLRLWQELDIPEGWRAELSYEGVTMTPPPSNPHVNVASLVHRALARALPDQYQTHQVLGVSFALAGRIFFPDLCVTREGELPEDSVPLAAGKLLLAVEITSRGNARHDRNTRKWAYAHGGVPLYVLVDRYDEDGPSVTLFSDPVDGHYQRASRSPFGAKVALPEPFGIELDTSGF
ncbi:Uma2 family endonuclease [Sciscionella sediminilitoris]|uniref:Uma2 family endonuclease n=1 Tax=Sciscionella sediminilitoris TaxID=1445613 RepID=UPI0004DF1B74|nr:Uma2 family endonuclease [Sciscionella sp. SE31]